MRWGRGAKRAGFYIIGNFSMTKNIKAHSKIVATTNKKNAMRLTKTIVKTYGLNVALARNG